MSSSSDTNESVFELFKFKTFSDSGLDPLVQKFLPEVPDGFQVINSSSGLSVGILQFTKQQIYFATETRLTEMYVDRDQTAKNLVLCSWKPHEDSFSVWNIFLSFFGFKNFVIIHFLDSETVNIRDICQNIDGVFNLKSIRELRTLH
jgi:hypothetical protein